MTFHVLFFSSHLISLSYTAFTITNVSRELQRKIGHAIAPSVVLLSVSIEFNESYFTRITPAGFPDPHKRSLSSKAVQAIHEQVSHWCLFALLLYCWYFRHHRRVAVASVVVDVASHILDPLKLKCQFALNFPSTIDWFLWSHSTN